MKRPTQMKLVTARQQHECDNGCGRPIEIGEAYFVGWTKEAQFITVRGLTIRTNDKQTATRFHESC